jgi:ankyrin repeat protein
MGYTPFRYAAMDYFSKEDAGDIILFLISKGANVNEKDRKGETALHGLALNGKIDLIRILLDNGAQVNAATNEGVTPLHLAACCCKGEIQKQSLNCRQPSDWKT